MRCRRPAAGVPRQVRRAQRPSYGLGRAQSEVHELVELVVHHHHLAVVAVEHHHLGGGPADQLARFHPERGGQLVAGSDVLSRLHLRARSHAAEILLETVGGHDRPSLVDVDQPPIATDRAHEISRQDLRGGNSKVTAGGAGNLQDHFGESSWSPSTRSNNSERPSSAHEKAAPVPEAAVVARVA
jgi:hypothetical protein